LADMLQVSPWMYPETGHCMETVAPDRFPSIIPVPANPCRDRGHEYSI
jgi:hypothetical protein